MGGVEGLEGVVFEDDVEEGGGGEVVGAVFGVGEDVGWGILLLVAGSLVVMGKGGWEFGMVVAGEAVAGFFVEGFVGVVYGGDEGIVCRVAGGGWVGGVRISWW